MVPERRQVFFQMLVDFIQFARQCFSHGRLGPGGSDVSSLCTKLTRAVQYPRSPSHRNMYCAPHPLGSFGVMCKSGNHRRQPGGLSNKWFIDPRGQFIIHNRRVFCTDRQKHFSGIVQFTERRFEPYKTLLSSNLKVYRAVNLPTHRYRLYQRTRNHTRPHLLLVYCIALLIDLLRDGFKKPHVFRSTAPKGTPPTFG
jgi:hypothetical protein